MSIGCIFSCLCESLINILPSLGSMQTKTEFNTYVYDTKIDDIKAGKEAKIRINLALNLIGKNKKVLDIGCYEGYISEKIKNYGNEVVGLEISEIGAKLCNERGIKCFHQDIEAKLPFSDNSFDVVFGGEVIEHVFDTDSLLQEIKRILKPKGYVVLTTPNIASLPRRLRLLLGINPMIDIGLISPQGEKSAGHIRYFTKKSLEQLLNRNGFFIDQWSTDFIIFNRLRLAKLGKLFPKLGYTLIIKASRRH